MERTSETRVAPAEDTNSCGYDLREHVRSRMKRGTELVLPLCVSRPARKAANVLFGQLRNQFQICIELGCI